MIRTRTFDNLTGLMNRLLGSDDALPWRIMAREIRRWRYALMAGAAAPLVFGLLLAWGYKTDVFFMWVQVGFVLLTVYIGTSLLRGVRRQTVVLELLITPLPSRSYASALMRMYLVQAVIMGVTSLAAIAGMGIRSGSFMVLDLAAAILVLHCFAAAVYWGGVLGLRGLSAALFIPLSAFAIFVAVNIFYFWPKMSSLIRRGIHDSPELRELVKSQEFYFRLEMYAVTAALAAYAILCAVRCYRNYDAVLQKRIA